MKARFQDRIKKLVDVDAFIIWNTFKNDILEACDEVCGKKKGRRNHSDTWWWNEEAKKATRQKKVAYKKMCENQSEENLTRYKNMKN